MSIGTLMEEGEGIGFRIGEGATTGGV